MAGAGAAACPGWGLERHGAAGSSGGPAMIRQLNTCPFCGPYPDCCEIAYDFRSLELVFNPDGPRGPFAHLVYIGGLFVRWERDGRLVRAYPFSWRHPLLTGELPSDPRAVPKRLQAEGFKILMTHRCNMVPGEEEVYTLDASVVVVEEAAMWESPAYNLSGAGLAEKTGLPPVQCPVWPTKKVKESRGCRQ
jgi:hypothetical protein